MSEAAVVCAGVVCAGAGVALDGGELPEVGVATSGREIEVVEIWPLASSEVNDTVVVQSFPTGGFE